MLTRSFTAAASWRLNVEREETIKVLEERTTPDKTLESIDVVSQQKPSGSADSELLDVVSYGSILDGVVAPGRELLEQL